MALNTLNKTNKKCICTRFKCILPTNIQNTARSLKQHLSLSYIFKQMNFHIINSLWLFLPQGS